MIKPDNTPLLTASRLEHRQDEERRKTEAAKREKGAADAHRARQRDDLARLMRVVLGLDCNPDSGSISVDGVTFCVRCSSLYIDNERSGKPCTVHESKYREIHSKADLGAWLEERDRVTVRQRARLAYTIQKRQHEEELFAARQKTGLELVDLLSSTLGLFVPASDVFFEDLEIPRINLDGVIFAAASPDIDHYGRTLWIARDNGSMTAVASWEDVGRVIAIMEDAADRGDDADLF